MDRWIDRLRNEQIKKTDDRLIDGWMDGWMDFKKDKKYGSVE